MWGEIVARKIKKLKNYKIKIKKLKGVKEWEE